MMNITVIGSGTMGNGIAHTFAQHGFNVSLVDISQQALDGALQTITSNLDRQIKKGSIDEKLKTATLNNIKTFTDLKTASVNADLVVEAAIENRDIKLNLFKQLSGFCKDSTILASNTSSISITQIAAVTKNPGKVVGMHFMNPVPVMKLVEV
ncbi:MAG TPA: 3-hydroxyacyl-CoA dehydrogenase NAD-binding domain-containing protein, partial [Mucilaginibacter sp.]